MTKNYNINGVIKEMHENKGLKKNVLNQIRLYLFKKAAAYKNNQLSIKQLVDDVMHYASNSLEKGIITQDDVVSEIAKIIKDIDLEEFLSNNDKKR